MLTNYYKSIFSRSSAFSLVSYISAYKFLLYLYNIEKDQNRRIRD